MWCFTDCFYDIEHNYNQLPCWYFVSVSRIYSASTYVSNKIRRKSHKKNMTCLCLGSNLENESSVRKSIEVNSEI